jgi:quercetin dioxygenase-like cupin family protein
MTRPAAVPTVQIDNHRLRVTEWRFAPGAATGWHRHEHDYVVVPVTTGRLLLEEKDGVSRYAELAAGGSYAREAGVEHDVVNATDSEFVFIEIELKEPVMQAESALKTGI